MNRKITIRDVAARARVSTATVSYVLNGRTDQKISEPTRKRVMAAVRELKYQPDILAAHLARQSVTKIVGIYYSGTEMVDFRISRRTRVITSLSRSLMALGYSVLLMNQRTEENLNLPSCVVAIDVTEETYRRIKEKIYVPIVLFDSMVDDPEVFQAYEDFGDIVTALRQRMYPDEKFFFLTGETHNKMYQSFLSQGFDPKDVHFFENTENLKTFMAEHPTHWGILVGQEMANILADLGIKNRTFTVAAVRGGGGTENNTTIFRNMEMIVRNLTDIIQRAIAGDDKEPKTLVIR